MYSACFAMVENVSEKKQTILSSMILEILCLWKSSLLPSEHNKAMGKILLLGVALPFSLRGQLNREICERGLWTLPHMEMD